MSEIYMNDVDWKATAKDLAERLQAVEKLHPNINGECHTCSNENGPLPWPCPTKKVVQGE